MPREGDNHQQTSEPLPCRHIMQNYLIPGDFITGNSGWLFYNIPCYLYNLQSAINPLYWLHSIYNNKNQRDKGTSLLNTTTDSDEEHHTDVKNNNLSQYCNRIWQRVFNRSSTFPVPIRQHRNRYKWATTITRPASNRKQGQFTAHCTKLGSARTSSNNNAPVSRPDTDNAHRVLVSCAHFGGWKETN